ncbi:MAG TPA: hydrogenase maturation protease [Enhygromyxa sp.]|nr:hydrogenase maturation protease [Enhygromyxa sp.]
MTRVRVLALGSLHGGDDEVALTLARSLVDQGVDLVLAGRPGAGLVDLLDTELPVLLLDVVRSGARPGTIVELSLAQLCERALAIEQVSSHGFGPAEALQLAGALGRELPRGRFLGIEGASFELGAEPSPELLASLPELERRARAALRELAG